MKINYLKYFVLIFSFIYVYNPRLLGVSSINGIYALSIGYLYFNHNKYINLLKKNNKLLGVIFVGIIILLYAIFKDSLYNDYFGISYSRQWFYVLLDTLIVMPALFIILVKYNIYYNNIKKLLIDLAIIQSVIALAMFFLPEFRDIIFLKILGYKQGVDVILNPFVYSLRGFGFGSSFLYSLPLFQSLAILLIVDKIMNKKIISPKEIIFILLLTFSIAFNARIGLIIFPIILISYYSSFENNIKETAKITFYIALILILFLYNYNLIRSYIVNINETFAWLVKGVELLFESDKTQGESVLEILIRNSLHLPETISGLVFGTGSYIFANPNSPYSHSDIGYIRDIYFGGLIYMISGFVYYFFLIRISNLSKFIKVSLFIFILVAHFKGDILSPNVFSRGFILLSGLSLLLINNRYKRFKIIKDD